MENSIINEDTEDIILVELLLNGKINAFDEIVKRYGKWIYNLSMRMSGNYHDAEDNTQEIFVKILTKLSSFKKKSSFKTWLYRLTVNHLLDVKRSYNEKLFESFDVHSSTLENLTDFNTKSDDVESGVYVNELKTNCVSGMLLCLNRAQRLVFILGALLGINSIEASKILDISEVNFRKKLSRARRDLKMYMDNQCGLIDANNSCRCSKKVKSAIEKGFIDPKKLQFKEDYLLENRQVAAKRIKNLGNVDEFKVEHLFMDLSLSSSNLDSIVPLIDKDRLCNLLELKNIV